MSSAADLHEFAKDAQLQCPRANRNIRLDLRTLLGETIMTVIDV